MDLNREMPMGYALWRAGTVWSETSIDAAASDQSKTDDIVHAMITETGK